MKTHKDFLTEKEQKRLYLVHHMHHIKSGKSDLHELHHCFLFTKKKLKGEKYAIKHLIAGGKLYHILNKNFSGALFDHRNKIFKIVSKKLKSRNYSVLK